MSLLVTDSSGVWEYVHDGMLPKKLPFVLNSPCMPCVTRSLMACCCAHLRECVCLARYSLQTVSRMPAIPGISSMTFSPCGRYLYQLGAEADSIHTRLTATGELLFAAPVGVFPRSMKLRCKGRKLIVAGGATGETCILTAPDLLCEKTIYTRHPCFAADICRSGLLLVCAAEGEDIQTVIYLLGEHSVRPRKLAELPGQPGGMCVCPDGQTALVSTPDGLMKLDLLTGNVLWNRPEWPLCMRMECREQTLLISDTLDGNVWTLNHMKPWEHRLCFSATSAQACFL